MEKIGIWKITVLLTIPILILMIGIKSMYEQNGRYSECFLIGLIMLIVSLITVFVAIKNTGVQVK